MFDGSMRLATSPDGQSWDEPSLVEEFRSGDISSGYWSIWNWTTSHPPPSPFEVVLSTPEEPEAATTRELLESLRLQLQGALILFSQERGWPTPSYRLRHQQSTSTDWNYRFSLAGSLQAHGEVRPNKLLVMGDEQQLAPVLGLETVDPLLGLPAKWIAPSQLTSAQAAKLHVFDSSGLIAAHALHALQGQWHRALGLLDFQRFLLAALPNHRELWNSLLPNRAALLLATIKELIAEELWLPHPARLLELFWLALPDFEPDDPGCREMVVELMRKEIVASNLPRLTDDQGELQLVEWRGSPQAGSDGEPSSADSGTHRRLLSRLEHALSTASTDVVSVITDLESRAELSKALRGPFPELAVLSWAELPPQAQIRLVAVVDTALEVDPSPWSHGSFEVGMR